MNTYLDFYSYDPPNWFFEEVKLQRGKKVTTDEYVNIVWKSIMEN